MVKRQTILPQWGINNGARQHANDELMTTYVPYCRLLRRRGSCLSRPARMCVCVVTRNANDVLHLFNEIPNSNLSWLETLIGSRLFTYVYTYALSKITMCWEPSFIDDTCSETYVRSTACAATGRRYASYRYRYHHQLAYVFWWDQSTQDTGTAKRGF